MSAGTTRRVALKGIATAAAITAIPTSAAMPSLGLGEWDAALAAHARAERQAEALYKRTDVADQAFYPARDKVPHVTVAVEGGSQTFSTKDEHVVRWARSSSTTLRYLEDLPGNYATYRAYHQLLAAHDAREEKIAELDRHYGWSATHDAYDAAVARQIEAEKVLFDMPAPDGEALLWKMERLYKPGEGIWSEGVEDQAHADLRRFLSHGRA